MRQPLLDKTFKDKNGRWALMAIPNLPIVIWAVAALASRMITQGTAHKVLSFIAFIALFIWALWELFKGVNYLRRAIGLIILIFTIHARFFS